MPNHIQNLIKFKCSGERLAEILNNIKKDKDEIEC